MKAVVRCKSLATASSLAAWLAVAGTAGAADPGHAGSSSLPDSVTQEHAARDAVLRAGQPVEPGKGLPPNQHRYYEGKQANDASRQPAGSAAMGASGESQSVQDLRQQSRGVSKAAQQAAVEARNQGDPGMTPLNEESRRVSESAREGAVQERNDGPKVLGGPAAQSGGERQPTQ